MKATEQEIKVRKPNPPKCFGIANIYERYTNAFYKWRSLLPNNGDEIRITWLPKNNGIVNAYIGMEGIVENIDKINGTFSLNCETSILICGMGNFNYTKI